MKANELRIGNRVFYKEEVVEVFKIDGTQYSFGKIDVGIRLLNPMRYEMHDLRQLKPVPITHGLLEKCGFRKSKLEGFDVHFKYSHPKLHTDIVALYDSEFSIKLDDVARGVKYLHQLQNLAFALTGEELNINLEEK